ncbi:methyltransferase domain-containing protein [Paenibacillus frigoriresistens]|nr:methyltransferase domain-containing protein [Paenibacillus frigoriresistens]
MDYWQGNFGKEYTDRNKTTIEQFENIYKEQFGVIKSELNKEFLGNLSLNNVLEIGSNVGDQLRCLQTAGYQNLYGIELQWYAVEQAKQNCSNINFIQGSAFDVPFRDSFFDLVFTNGVLIHISPSDLPLVMSEMVRVSKRYIWGFEYYADSIIEIDYRGESDKMWKGNYAQMFLDNHPELRLVKESKYKHTGSDNRDQMYLLEKMV